MKVIPPIQISSITSSTVPEEVAATYNAGTTYAIGAEAGLVSTYGSPQTVWRSKQNGNVGQTLADGDWWQNAGIVYPVYNSGSSCNTGGIVTDLANHDLYESLIDSNTGHALSDTTKWKYIGKTNRFRLFDYTRNNRTSAPLSFTVVFAPGQRIDSIALAGLIANDYTISVSSTSGGGVVYSASGSLTYRRTRTWYDYFFGEFRTRPSLAVFNVPPYSDNVITVTLDSDSGQAAAGALIVGNFVELGMTQYNAVSDVLNFSTVERDEDGNAILTQRRNIPKTRQTVFSKKTDVDRIIEARAALNAVPAIWYGLDDPSDGYFEAVSILGFYRDFQINITYPENAILSIELEEV